MKTPAAPIPFAGSQLGDVRHVCAFFNNADEEYQVLLPFIKDGFACGDKAVHVVSPEQRGTLPGTSTSSINAGANTPRNLGFGTYEFAYRDWRRKPQSSKCSPTTMRVARCVTSK